MSASGGAGPEGRDQLIATFVDITHASAARAEQMLQACNWDLEQAVALQLASDDGPPGGDHAINAGGPGPRRAATSDVEAGASPVNRPGPGGSPAAAGQPGGGVGSGEHLTEPLIRRSNSLTPSLAESTISTNTSMNWLMRVVHRVWGGVWWLGTGIFGFLNVLIFGPSQSGPAADSFAAMFGQRYGAPHPNLFRGTFAQAIRDARRQNRPVVVYLHSEAARHTMEFCRDVLRSPVIREVLDANYLFVGLDISRMEGHTVATQLLRARAYPHVSVILPASMDDLRQLAVVEGDISVDQLLAVLTSCVEDAEQHRAQQAAQQVQQEHDRLLREQQDREYQESLALDAEREAARQREAAQREAEEREERRKQEALEAKMQARAARAQAVEDRRAREAEKFRNAPVAPGADTSKILFRLPAGKRVERHFRADDTVQALYEFADCCGALDPGNLVDVPRNFQLSTTFPPRVLADKSRTLREEGLVPNGVVLLVDLGEEESEGEAA